MAKYYVVTLVFGLLAVVGVGMLGYAFGSSQTLEKVSAEIPSQEDIDRTKDIEYISGVREGAYCSFTEGDVPGKDFKSARCRAMMDRLMRMDI